MSVRCPYCRCCRSPLPETDRKRLSRVAARLTTADAHGHGDYLRTAAR